MKKEESIFLSLSKQRKKKVLWNEKHTDTHFQRLLIVFFSIKMNCDYVIFSSEKKTLKIQQNGSLYSNIIVIIINIIIILN